MADLLRTQSLRKEYRRSRWARTPSFVLQADLAFDEPAIIGVLGPNGSGKTTLFELITGSNAPTAGSVRSDGQDIHRVRRNRARTAGAPLSPVVSDPALSIVET